MLRARTVVFFLVSSMLVLAAAPSLAGFATPATQRPMIRAGSFSSTNWSGYAVTGPSGSVTDVKGSWVVPAIVGTCPSTNQYSSHWVGIDGFSSNTVEQTGTDSDCQNGAPRYYAWYEFYPKPSFIINTITVHPNDVIKAEVKYSGGRFTATITDTTTGASFSTSAKVNAQRSSAEWITEAPYSGGILPLADFGTINWGTDYTAVASTNYATVGAVTAAIGSFGSSVQSITMVSQSDSNQVKAQPEPLSTDGTSFQVTWVSVGP